MRRLALILSLLSATAAADELPSTDPGGAFDRAADARADELAKPAYAFCHDEDYEAESVYGDRRFCDTWSEETTRVCPEARALCADKPPSWWSQLELALPPWLGWLIFASALLVCVVLFVRALLRESRASVELDLGAAVDDALAGQLQALPEAPALAILRRAREALAAGRPDDASILAQLACLRWFDDEAYAAFHPSKTNGEYLRALRASPAHHELYRRVARETDRVRFGGAGADPLEVASILEAFDALYAQKRRPPPGQAALAGLAVMALLAAQQGCEDERKPYYSHRPSGYSALPSMLRKLDLSVKIGRHRVDEIPEDVGVVVLLSSLARQHLSLDALLDRDVRVLVLDDALRAEDYLPVKSSSVSAVHVELQGLPQLLHLGRGVGAPEALFVNDRLGPSARDPLCGVPLAWIDARLGKDRVRLPRGPALVERAETGTTAVSRDMVWVEPLLFAELDDDELAARAYAGVRLAEGEDGAQGTPKLGCLFVFGSGELFSNASLTLPQNARFVGALFAALTPRGKSVLLLDGLDSAKTGIDRSLADSRLLPFILQGLLWVALFFVSIGAAFGPLRDPVKVEHKAFVEHVEALGRHYSRMGEAGLTHVARSLARYAALRHRGEARGGWANLARQLAERYSLPEADVRAALRLGSDAAAELGPPVSPEAARSEGVLRVLSVLISGRARAPKKVRR